MRQLVKSGDAHAGGRLISEIRPGRGIPLTSKMCVRRRVGTGAIVNIRGLNHRREKFRVGQLLLFLPAADRMDWKIIPCVLRCQYCRCRIQALPDIASYLEPRGRIHPVYEMDLHLHPPPHPHPHDHLHHPIRINVRMLQMYLYSMLSCLVVAMFSELIRSRAACRQGGRRCI